VSATITAAITAARGASGLTRDEVVTRAREAGAPAALTVAAYRNLESGRRAPSVDELLWLAAALQVPARQLLGEHADAFTAAPVVPTCGPIETATRAAVEELADLVDQQQALAESAYALARALDGGALQSPAPVARELRATLSAIWEGQDAGGDEDDTDPE
jgi:transcriptional regulator with XRE-family HTH domain